MQDTSDIFQKNILRTEKEFKDVEMEHCEDKQTNNERIRQYWINY